MCLDSCILSVRLQWWCSDLQPGRNLRVIPWSHLRGSWCGATVTTQQVGMLSTSDLPILLWPLGRSPQDGRCDGFGVVAWEEVTKLARLVCVSLTDLPLPVVGKSKHHKQEQCCRLTLLHQDSLACWKMLRHEPGCTNTALLACILELHWDPRWRMVIFPESHDMGTLSQMWSYDSIERMARRAVKIAPDI